MQDNHGFARRPTPRPIGRAERGQRVLDGAAPAEAEGFGWLDDLAALGSPAARERAQAAVLDWVARHAGEPALPDGPARPDITGRRLRAWVFHAGLILPGLDRAASAPVFAAMHRDLAALSQTAHRAPAGGRRIEAFAGLAIAALSLRGAEPQAAPALDGLAAAARTLPESAGRNPEALLDQTALLVWATDLAAEAGRTAPDGLLAAIAGAQPLLAALRQADGSLARSHGGGAGVPGRLAQVLRGAATAAPDPAMGFARLAQGATTVICDIAAPPASPTAHAAALGFQMASGAQPIITACGSGTGVAGWTEASRATAAHSTLVLDGLSSARLEEDGTLSRPAVGGEVAGATLAASHAGWQDSHGLIHRRSLRLEGEGLLRGEDALIRTAGAAAPAAADTPVALHFHLHPAVRPVVGAEGALLGLPDGQRWLFSHDGPAALSIEPSVWLDEATGAHPSQQLVLRLTLGAMGAPVAWRLGRQG